MAGHPRLKTAWGLDSLKLSSPYHEYRNLDGSDCRATCCCHLVRDAYFIEE